jgi:hypothetical protein
MCLTAASDESVYDEFVDEIYQKYIVKTDNSGQTIMWHGLPTKYQVEPHLLKFLDAIAVTDVQCLYMPLNHWEKKGNPRGKCRNKGYAFIHFATETAASDFTRKVTDNKTESPPMLTATTKAERQGISANLRALVAAPQKKITAGSFCLPNKAGALENVPIHALRDLSGRSTSFSRSDRC